jgi:soluble lytic murein transglycosylase
MDLKRRLPQVLIVAALLGLVALISVLALSRTRGTEVAETIRGDVEEAFAAIATEDLPPLAETLLATERPWRAARVMREYDSRVGEMTPEQRILAARAEAGSNGWSAVQALLTDLSGLESQAGGVPVYLLARAYDEAGEAPRAIELYRSYLELPGAEADSAGLQEAARLRLGLALIRAGELTEGTAALRASSGTAGGASTWIDLLRADALAQTGDTAAVRQAVARFDTGVLGLRGWRARILAAQRAQDLAGARALAVEAQEWARTDASRAELIVLEGRLAIEMGDAVAGRDAMRRAIDLLGSGGPAREAADALREGEVTAEDALRIARVDAAQGLQPQAVDEFQRWLEAGIGTPEERAAVHLEHADALFYAERYDEVAAALEPVPNSLDKQMLLARAASHRGDENEAVEIYTAIAEEHAGTGDGAQALFLAAGIRHDQNAFRRARPIYQQVIDEYPDSDQSGLAMMRMAGMAFVQNDFEDAAEIWDGYRSRYPKGDRVLEATYWAGRSRQEAGDSAGAAALFREVREAQRDSYYSLLASQRLGEPFWPLTMSEAPEPDAAAEREVAARMRGLDLLRSAGFEAEAAAEADRLLGSAGSDRETLYALAEALGQRGYTRNGIQIAERLQGTNPPDIRLLRILFPFPYRTLVTQEAADRNLDPFIAAALIRQESMFEARITSPAGARGLMQMMPATGGELAAAEGITDWNAEMLYLPEINVHLGTRYVAQHMASFDGSLPSVFSAYNAGEHRVEWWSQFEEYGEDEIFTERIPYRETREYVKILTRNRAIYAGLYGEE